MMETESGAGLYRPVALYGLAALRIMLGLLWAMSMVRLLAYDWIEPFYSEPSYHFSWIEGLPILPGWGLKAVVLCNAVTAIGIAVGWRTRLMTALFSVGFIYLELIEKSLYLNHYVLVSLLALAFCVLPVHRVWSLDVVQGRVKPSQWLPAWQWSWLRVLVGSVYVWAGLCKVEADWLFRGEPLHTWLRARADLPVVGPWLALPETAVAMAWGGTLFDLLIPFLLMHPRVRRLGALLAVGFHVTIWLLFPIGIFPWLMLICCTVFLPPDWPMTPSTEPPRGELGAPFPWAWGLALAVIALFPARFLLYPGHVNWTEQGFRFSWRVMLIEKTGSVEYVIVKPNGSEERILPRDELTDLQHKMMRTQPDMIAQYGRHLGRVHSLESGTVNVYADSWASLNGRPVQRLVSPEVNLAVPVGQLPEEWIVPLGEQLLRDQP